MRHSLGVEVALEIVLEIDDLQEVTPGQLSRQRRDNLKLGEGFGKADHVAQGFLGKSPAELVFQLSPQCGNDLFTVPCPFLA